MGSWSRRQFLLASAVVVPLLPVVPAAVCRASTTQDAVRGLAVELPGLLFFPERRTKTATLEVMTLEPKASRVALQFVDGATLRLDADSSYAKSKRKTLRERVMLKSLGAWVIDSALREVERERRPAAEPLLTQHVLETVTPRALHRLVKTLRSRQTITQVSWNASQARFVVR